MYYFYSDKFNLLATLERIIKRNIKRRKYRLKDLLVCTFNEQKLYNLSQIEEKHDSEILRNDILLLSKNIKVYHRIIKYIQNHFNIFKISRI